MASLKNCIARNSTEPALEIPTFVRCHQHPFAQCNADPSSRHDCGSTDLVWNTRLWIWFVSLQQLPEVCFHVSCDLLFPAPCLCCFIFCWPRQCCSADQKKVQLDVMSETQQPFVIHRVGFWGTLRWLCRSFPFCRYLGILRPL